MKVCICGSRDYDRVEVIEAFLNGLKIQFGDDLHVIEGGARGADEIAREWAKDNIHRHNRRTFEADWNAYGNSAGPIRNSEMLDLGNPDLVIAFKDDFDHTLEHGGTEDMCKQSLAADKPVFLFERL